MGLLSDAYQRVLAFTTKRDAPTYSPPSARPADSQHASTNADLGVANVRKYVAEGSPARTRPMTGDATGSTPSQSSAGGFRSSVDTRPAGRFPKAGSETSTNVSGDAPSVARALPYGLQPDPAQQMRPAASVAVAPKSFGGE